MWQGEIWEMYFDPVEGNEQAGRRPALIISGDLLNKYLNLVIVCPLTTRVKHYKGNVVLNPNSENMLNQTSEVLTFHVRSVTKTRLKKKIGKISEEELKQVKKGLDDILKY